LDEDENKDPAQITFVHNAGFKNSLNVDKFRPQRKMLKIDIELMYWSNMIIMRLKICVLILVYIHIETVVKLSKKMTR
jgi:hypothetical protein